MKAQFNPPPPDAGARTSRPLEGLNVVELAAVLAGPSVGSFLAELGARVIKVENPQAGGDVTRGWKMPGEPQERPQSAYYASVNWGKTVVQADLRNPDELAEVHELLGQADVVLSSFRPGSDRKLGLDPRALMARYPRLICARITGFGPDSDRPAYDLVLQAETGWMAMNGMPDQPGIKLPVALVDVLAAHQLKEGILLALLERERSGCGSLVDVSLYDAALSGLANQASNFLMNGVVPRPMGSLHPNIAPYGECFTCRDGQTIALAVGSDAQFRGLCQVLKLPELAADPRFAVNAERVRHRQALSQLLEPAFAHQDLEHWLQALQAADVPAAAICTLDQVFGRPQARDMVLLDDQDGQRTRQAAFWLRPL